MVLGMRVVHASSTSPFRGAGRCFVELSVAQGQLRALRGDGTVTVLTHSDIINACGHIESYDVDDRRDGTLPGLERTFGTLVWVQSEGEIFIFPVQQWWPGSTPLSTLRGLRSSGFVEFFDELGQTLPRRSSVWPTTSPITVVGNTTRFELGRDVTSLHAWALLAAVAPSLAVSIAFFLALGGLNVVGVVFEALPRVTCAICVAASITAILPVWAWTRRRSGTPERSPLRLGRTGLAVSAGKGVLHVTDADGLTQTYAAGTGSPGALNTWFLSDGPRPLLRFWDGTGAPRLHIKFPREAEAPGLARDVSEMLNTLGLEHRKGKVGGTWPTILPATPEWRDYTDALMGTGGAWRVPALVMSVAIFVACAAFCFPPLIELSDDPGDHMSTLIALVALAVAFLLVLGTVLSCPARHLLARWRWARDVRRRRRECS